MLYLSQIHLILVHFPILLTLIGVLIEGLYLFKSGKFCYSCGELILYFATISALVATALGGLFTPNLANHALAQTKNFHSFFAVITVMILCATSVIYLMNAFMRSYMPRYVIYSHEIRLTGFVFYILSAILVSITGFWGGVLVYNDLHKM